MAECEDDVTQLQHYCLSPLIVNTPKTEYPEICESFDFGTSLQNVYPLLRPIFKYLAYADLKSAALVNETWNKYAIEELEKRNKPSWINCTRIGNFKLNLEKSINYMYDEISFGLIFYSRYNVLLDTCICVHRPNIVRIPFVEYLRTEVLPKEKDFWTFSSENIYSITKPSDEGNIEACNPVFTCLFIPTIPNIRVRTFLSTTKKSTNIGKILERNIPLHETIHCMLLFTLSYRPEFVERIMKTLLKRQNCETMALGGGVIPGIIKPFEQSNQRELYTLKDLYCIAFTQERDVPAEFDAFSIVIKEQDDLEAKLLEFKQNTVQRRNGFIIRISCEANKYKKAATLLLYKHFPNIAIVGLDAAGEVGWNKVNDSTDENHSNKKKRSKLFPKTSHAYTTILVMITWDVKTK